MDLKGGDVDVKGGDVDGKGGDVDGKGYTENPKTRRMNKEGGGGGGDGGDDDEDDAACGDVMLLEATRQRRDILRAEAKRHFADAVACGARVDV
eukprot:2896140-Pyramimonas_sp.AAC.1